MALENGNELKRVPVRLAPCDDELIDRARKLLKYPCTKDEFMRDAAIERAKKLTDLSAPTPAPLPGRKRPADVASEPEQAVTAEKGS